MNTANERIAAFRSVLPPLSFLQTGCWPSLARSKMGQWRCDPRFLYGHQHEGFPNTKSVDMYTGQPHPRQREATST